MTSTRATTAACARASSTAMQSARAGRARALRESGPRASTTCSGPASATTCHKPRTSGFCNTRKGSPPGLPFPFQQCVYFSALSLHLRALPQRYHRCPPFVCMSYSPTQRPRAPSIRVLCEWVGYHKSQSRIFSNNRSSKAEPGDNEWVGSRDTQHSTNHHRHKSPRPPLLPEGANENSPG